MTDQPNDVDLTNDTEGKFDLNEPRYYSSTPEQMSTPVSQEISPSPEVQENFVENVGASAEKEPEAEKLNPLIEQPEVLDENPEEVSSSVELPTDNVVPNVFDKEQGNKTETHPLTTDQQLTAQADKEEEDFIEHVEEAHLH